jgi:hypothetical protein
MNSTRSDQFPVLIATAFVTQTLLAIVLRYFQSWIYNHFPLPPVVIYPVVATLILVFFINRITNIEGIEMNYGKSFSICSVIILLPWIIANIIVKYFELHPYTLFRMGDVVYTGMALLFIAFIVAAFYQQSKIDYGPKGRSEGTLD